MPAAAPPVFAAFQGASRQAGFLRRRLGLTVVVSMVLHAGLLAAAAAGAFSRPHQPAPAPPPRVVVTLGRLAPPRPPPAPPAPPRPPPPRKTVTARPVLAAVQPALIRELPPAPAEPLAVEEPGGEGEGDAGAEEGPAGSPSGGIAPAPPPAPPPPPAMTADQRRQLLARYLQQALRPRIDSRFIYPPEAEREGVEGTVLLRLTIDCGGQLLSAVTVGSCPADLLCEHARATTRRASPFPPPPRELGATIQVDVPIAYRLN